MRSYTLDEIDRIRAGIKRKRSYCLPDEEVMSFRRALAFPGGIGGPLPNKIVVEPDKDDLEREVRTALAAGVDPSEFDCN